MTTTKIKSAKSTKSDKAAKARKSTAAKASKATRTSKAKRAPRAAAPANDNTTPRTVGRPASTFPERTQVRHSLDQLATWKRAAASSGMHVQEWLRATLDAEAATATHVQMITRA